jgi:preprotein translocase subunit SecG
VERNEMKPKIIIILLIVLFLVSVAAIDAKSSGRSGGKSSGFHSKSVSSKATSSFTDGAAKMIGISSLGMAAKNTKKKTHLDDDLFENETENGTAQQSPGMGVMTAFLAISMLLIARRKRMV